MQLPFTKEQFFEIFSKYNQAIWPMQIIFYIIAAGVIWLLFVKKSYTGRLVYAILSFLWLWMGIIYHFIFFSTINPASRLFGSIFVLEALLWGFFAIKSPRVIPISWNRWQTGAGFLLIAYALIIYPIIGHITGHQFPSSPTFGLPCPTVIFTFGIFLIAYPKDRWYLLIIPFLWSIVGGTAAFKLGVPGDYGLIVAGLFLFPILIARKEPVQMATSSV